MRRRNMQRPQVLMRGEFPKNQPKLSDYDMKPHICPTDLGANIVLEAEVGENLIIARSSLRMVIGFRESLWTTCS